MYMLRFVKPPYLILKALFSRVIERAKISLKHYQGYHPVVIYQMGKVGSMTIYETLTKSVENPVFHVHFLIPNEVERVKNKYLEAGIVYEPQHMRDSQFLSNYLKHSKSTRWHIITLVRDPISAKMSHLFHNPRIHHKYLFDKEGNLNKQRALEVSYNKLMDFDPTSDFVCNWINKEFYNYLKIDLYRYTFDKERGFQIIDAENYKILVLQTESIDQGLVRALKEMRMIDKDIPVLRSNENENKEFSELYKMVRDNIKIPSRKINEIYNSKYVRHFYSSAFISSKIDQWTKRP